MAAAAGYLQGDTPLPGTWRNDQYVLSVNRGGGFRVVADVSTPAGLADVQRVLDGITGAYSWPRLALPTFDRRYTGTWRSSRDELPPGWPSSANSGDVVSFAVTGRQRYCWTEPDNDRALPALGEAVFG